MILIEESPRQVIKLAIHLGNPGLIQPIRLTGAWRQVPKKLYIRCAQYPGRHFDRYLATAEADPDWIGIGTEFPHDIMMTDPDWLADILREHVL